jgi:hypothetical protein
MLEIVDTNDLGSAVRSAVFFAALLFAPMSFAQSEALERELRSISEVRDLLTEELNQYEKTLALLVPAGARAANSTNPTVKSIAAETLRVRQRLISITEREVSLIQKRIAAYKAAATEYEAEVSENEARRNPPPAYSIEDEANDVARLLTLLTRYYADLEESLNTMPTEEELEKRRATTVDAATLAQTPFSADKVRLSGAEGIAALARMSQRLSDERVPESRRDIAPLCGIKTRFFGSLIASENRSLKPVGKNQYVARIRIQPGDTSLRVRGNTWEIRLPQDIDATDYLVTLFLPKFGKPELHVFAVDDLLAEGSQYIPAWLPEELNLKRQTG